LRVEGLGLRIQGSGGGGGGGGSGFEVSDLGIGVSVLGHGFRDEGFGSLVSGLEIMTLGSGYLLLLLLLLRAHLPYGGKLIRHTPCRRRSRSNQSGKYSQERLTRGRVTSTMRGVTRLFGWARCGAGAAC